MAVKKRRSSEAKMEEKKKNKLLYEPAKEQVHSVCFCWMTDDNFIGSTGIIRTRMFAIFDLDELSRMNTMLGYDDGSIARVST